MYATPFDYHRQYMIAKGASKGWQPGVQKDYFGFTPMVRTCLSFVGAIRMAHPALLRIA